MWAGVIIVTAAVSVAGCTGPDQTAGAVTAPPPASGAAAIPEAAPAGAFTAAPSPSSAAAGAPAGALPPVTISQSELYAPLSPTPDLDARIAAAVKSGNKKAIGDAYTERGATRMYDDKAGMRVKYRKALADFREALKADPTNQTAKAAKDQIESIYRSLHRPIPADGS